MDIILRDLSPEDTFNIIMFSDVVHKWQHSFVPANPGNINLAIQHIKNAEAEGCKKRNSSFIKINIKDDLFSYKYLRRFENVA